MDFWTTKQPLKSRFRFNWGGGGILIDIVDMKKMMLEMKRKEQPRTLAKSRNSGKEDFIDRNKQQLLYTATLRQIMEILKLNL